MIDIPTVMALWINGFIADQNIVRWADKKLLADEEQFDYLMKLSLHGAKTCANLPEYEFPKAREFSFIELFSLKYSAIDMQSNDSIINFISWLTYSCMGGDLDVEEIKFGYVLDHYLNECNDYNLSISYFNENIENFQLKSNKISQPIWQKYA